MENTINYNQNTTRSEGYSNNHDENKEKIFNSWVKCRIEDYIPMYGMLLGHAQLIEYESIGTISVKDLLQNYPHLYITYGQEKFLNQYDKLGFLHYLAHCKTKSEINEFLIKRLKAYTDSGQWASFWIRNTLNDLKTNPQSFPAKYLDALENKLLKMNEQYTTLVDIEPKENFPAVTVKSWAFYYYYLHDLKILPGFGNQLHSKTQAIKDIAYDHGFSAKSFELKYNSILKKANRLSRGNIYPINEAIKMFGDSYPNAVLRAQEELNQIELHFS